MPQITVNSNNISKFGFKATFNPLNQTVVFNTSELTTYNTASGTGFLYVQGICFKVVDQQGITLVDIDWNSPQIRPNLSETSYTLDLSSIGIDFFFQTYKIIGYIKDADNTVYSTVAINKKICQPLELDSEGYVSGAFQIISDCTNNVLTVKELTKFILNHEEPTEITKTGILSYPTGTISAINFTNTPFTNNVIYTGEYRINCSTTATYSLGDDIYIAVVYRTNNVFDVTCANRINDILCCIEKLQATKEANCNTSIGERAAQQLQEIELPLLIAFGKEMAGQDASQEVDYIKKKLRCNCGTGSIIRNEFSPTNPSINTINIIGVGGTSIATPTITGNTKTFNVKSNIYQVVKADDLDTSFSIEVDTATLNTIKYKIRLNYNKLSETILTTISNNSALLSQFNTLVNLTNVSIDLSNLNGKCIIDIGANNYFLSLKTPSTNGTFDRIVINGTTYTPSSPIPINAGDSIETYLNGLGLGTFTVSFDVSISGNYINILTVSNTNNIQFATFTLISLESSNQTTVPFQKTNKSIVAFLQALVDYICEISALNVSLGASVSYCYVDYNGEIVTATLSPTASQNQLNQGFSTALCQLTARATTTFTNALTKVLDVVKWGGTLIENTEIDQNAKTVKFICDGNNYVLFNNTSFVVYNSQGTAPTDDVNVLFTRYNLSVQQISTNADRAAIAYYAKAQQAISDDAGVGYSSVIGAYYPTTNGATPAPALDANKTAFVRAFHNTITGKGEVNLYAQKHTHVGEISNFDTLIRAKKMTSTERDAISSFLLESGLIIYNTTTNKHQGYNGTTWNDFY